MDREETIRRLCGLVTEVGSEDFKNKVEHDCFCSFGVDRPQVSEEVIAYIEQAVDEKRRLKINNDLLREAIPGIKYLATKAGVFETEWKDWEDRVRRYLNENDQETRRPEVRSVQA
jgi:hypothetical protein